MAENKDVNFRLGWHVLKNRDYDSRDCSVAERDQAEETFFSQGIWTSLPPSHMGIGSLKPRLSRVLKDQILSELPGLIQDVQAGVDDCKGRLQRLGGSRATKDEQRQHLSRVSQEFSRLLTAAVDGIYVDPFFGDSTTKSGYGKRLRAVVQNTLLDFANEMRCKGHGKEIVERLIEQGDAQEGSHGPPEVLRSQVVNNVENLMKRTRGRELPGTYNPQIVGELFFQHSAPWQGIVQAYAEQTFAAIKTTLNLVLEYTADPQTSEGLLRYVINPALEPIKQNLESKVAAILRHHQRGHPIT